MEAVCGRNAGSLGKRRRRGGVPQRLWHFLQQYDRRIDLRIPKNVGLWGRQGGINREIATSIF